MEDSTIDKYYETLSKTDTLKGLKALYNEVKDKSNDLMYGDNSKLTKILINAVAGLQLMDIDEDVEALFDNYVNSTLNDKEIAAIEIIRIMNEHIEELSTIKGLMKADDISNFITKTMIRINKLQEDIKDKLFEMI